MIYCAALAKQSIRHIFVRHTGLHLTLLQTYTTVQKSETTLHLFNFSQNSHFSASEKAENQMDGLVANPITVSLPEEGQC